MKDKQQPILSADTHNRRTEKISQYIFRTLLALACICFLLFYLVGFQVPDVENPAFNAPLFTGVLLFFMFFITAFAIGLACISFVFAVKKRRSSMEKNNNINVRKNTLIIVITTILLLLLTFVLAPTDEIMVNGRIYHDTLWLKLSFMFVSSTVILLAIAIITMLFGYTRTIRTH